MNYFISDLHLGHKNVLKFDNRPFINIEEHDKTIIDNWNSKVNDKDDVYVLGDISWHNATKTIEIFKQLKIYFLFTKSKISFNELFLNSTRTIPYPITDNIKETNMLTYRLDIYIFTKRQITIIRKEPKSVEIISFFCKLL